MIRLFVKDELQKNSLVSLEEKQIHYLLHVMRLKVNDRILLFNGHDGEYVANLIELSKNKAIACCEKNAGFFFYCCL